MKKGIFAILAALTVFALVMTGCPADNDDKPDPVKPGEPTLPFVLGDFTAINNDSQKGWLTNGTDDTTNNFEFVTLAAAKYLVLKTKGTAPNGDGFGGMQIAFQGDGNSWAWKNVALWGDWISYAHTATDEVSIVIKLDTLGDDYTTFLTGTQGKIYICYYSPDIAGLGIQSATLVATAPAKGDNPVDIPGGKGFIFGGSAPAPAEPYVEEITLNNGWFAIYKFTLPAGKTWGDYKHLKADYKLATVDTQVRARVFGNYTQSAVDQVRLGVSDGNNIAVVDSWPSGDSGSWILDNTWAGVTAANTLFPIATAEDPKGVAAAIEDDTWFTLTYAELGSTPHVQWNNGGNATTGDYYRYKAGRNPAATATGPFYLGVGLTTTGAAVTSQIKNVILFGTGQTDVIGEPLFISKDGKNYRAYAGQLDGAKDANGLYSAFNGGTPAWKIISGENSVKPVAYVALSDITITYNLNYPNTDTPPEIAPISIYPGDRITDTQIGTPQPPATPPAAGNWGFNGWFTAATGGLKVIARYQFDESATIYAQWVIALPDATADVDVDLATLPISSFGGLGALDTNAGPGPFSYDTTYQYDAAIWISRPAELATATYKAIQIKYTVVKTSSDTNPMKLAFHVGRADNSWGGGTPSYQDRTTDDEYTETFAVPAENGITVQHNKSGSASFTFTITGIKLIKP